jgi:hypothetical protein
VGIGNSNPERPLALTGTGASAEWLSLRNTNNATAWHLNSYLGGLNFAQSGVADARLFLSTNSGNVGIGTSLPGAKLDVNGAVRAGGGIVFPDGSVQTRAAAGSTSPTTISGYSPGTTVAVTLNDIGCELTGPLTISADSSALGLGSLDNATARVRRVRPAGASDWATAFGNVVIRGIPLSNPTNSFRLAVTVAQAGVATQSLTITNLFFTRYKLTGGNGQLWEEGDLIARANAAFPVVRLGAVPASSPSADVPGLSVVVNGSALPGTVMASLPLLATYPINVISVTNKFVGSMTMVPDVRLTLRANVSSGGALLDWLTDRSVSGYRTLAIRRSGSTLVAANSAYGSEYRLRIADDGLPIEELDVTCAQFTAP